ncbi:YciI family protein [Fuscovulum ytuae]|jgi:hypothetical protein|uniref:YciI family protein n=1 Tax=Fuscovulum ytuae TaxID=3042299 RepID=A0ABY8Q7V6_9RHOB|nr:YciI family protein [Fuscovulum sp. YMD61]WGV16914.1 YciI family protein [Fuscovulum sp. YMD61]
MKYMLLLYVDPAIEPKPGTPEWDSYMQGFMTVGERTKGVATFLAGDGLQGVETATSLRLRDGKRETMDGPFAETREHLGGFYLIEAPDLDAALTYASEIPVARIGTVEVRPVMVY